MILFYCIWSAKLFESSLKSNCFEISFYRKLIIYSCTESLNQTKIIYVH